MTFEKLDELIKAIAEYPDLKKYQNADGFFDSEVCPIPEVLDKRIEELSAHMAGIFIDSRGQHSDLYYKAKKAGYRLRVTEQDSFGPLGVLYTAKDESFMVGYG
jgi:hypothetical protein